jgi:hypothetical protein
MKVRFKNPFLLSVGAALLLGNVFYPNTLVAFFGGGCFGLIFLNLYESRNQ